VRLGEGTSVWDHVHIRRGTQLGEQCIVGGKSYIANDVRIGNRVKINASVYVCNAVTIEDGVMVSAGVIFTNDRFPRATTPDLKSCAPQRLTNTHCRRWSARARRSAPGAIIGCDLTIGRFAMIGMGSVVTRSVPDFHLVIGNPARSIGCVCRCGETLVKWSDDMPETSRVSCLACGLTYEIDGQKVSELDVELAAAMS